MVAYDTICTGWDAVRDQDDNIVLYEEWEADEEVNEDPDEFFKVHMDEYIHERRFMLSGDNNGIVGYISGIKPLKQ